MTFYYQSKLKQEEGRAENLYEKYLNARSKKA